MRTKFDTRFSVAENKLFLIVLKDICFISCLKNEYIYSNDTYND